MFQGYEQTIRIPFPNKGINITASNDPECARYIQNILLGSNNTGKVRHGTYLQSSFAYEPLRIYGNIIHGTSFLKLDGTSENIIYVNYLTLLPPYVDVEENVEISAVIGNPNISLITIDTTGLTADEKAFLVKRMYNGIYFYILQPAAPGGADISNVIVDLNANIISFTLPFPPAFFNDFRFAWERGGVYREGLNNTFDPVPLIDDLDPNVIVSSVNYQNLLLITNGVDPVFYYDGNNLLPVISDASIAMAVPVVIQGNDLVITVRTNIRPEYEEHLRIGTELKLVSIDAEQLINIQNIVFANIADNLTTITITCNIVPLVGTRNVIYKKQIPKFSYLEVGHNRLWALAEGRPLLKQFRPAELCQKVYFAAKQGSALDWFNERTGNVDFIDLSVNNHIPENIEVIKFFQGKMLFVGRHTTQIWKGDDPTANFDGQEMHLGNFEVERVLPVGIFQKSLCQEMANNFAIISTFGKSFSFYLNKFGQIDYIQTFIEPVRDYLEAQLSSIENDRDYREMTSFLYPYKDLLGIKIKNECLVYQIKNNGFWSCFSENFSDARSFFYNEVTKNLYLGMGKGKLLCYADKLENERYTDYNITSNAEKRLIWRIVYSWISPETTWHNMAIFLSVTSLRELPVNVKVYENNSETDPIESEIIVKQTGARFDADDFFRAVYTNQPTQYAYRSIRFNGESFMLEFNGFVENMFVFDKVILAGGVQNAN